MRKHAATSWHAIPSATRSRGGCLCPAGQGRCAETRVAGESISTGDTIRIRHGQGVFHLVDESEVLVRALRTDALDRPFARRDFLGDQVSRRASQGAVDPICSPSPIPAIPGCLCARLIWAIRSTFSRMIRCLLCCGIVQCFALTLSTGCAITGMSSPRLSAERYRSHPGGPITR